LEFPHQGDRREFVWAAIEGQPPVRQKRLILEAHAAGLIDAVDTQVFLDAAGLGRA
jgi:hypothetical protein